MRVRNALTIAVVATVACYDVAAPPADLAPQLLTPHVWSGGEIMLRVVGAPDSALLVIGADTITLTARDDSTMAGQAIQANETFDLALLAEGRWFPVAGAVRIYGYAGAILGAPILGYPQELARPGTSPYVLVNGETSLVRLDVRFGSAAGYPRTMHEPTCSRGPGPTPTPGVFILGRRGPPPNYSCIFALWRIEPTVQLLRDSIPGSLRTSALLGDTLVLIASNHQTCVHDVATAMWQPTYCRQHEDPAGLRFSPDGRRLIMYYAYSSTNGVPVWGSTEGDTVFSLRDAVSAHGGAFTAGSDTLFLVVLPKGGGALRLLVLNAANGQRLDSLVLDSLSMDDVLAEPGLPYVYLQGSTIGADRKAVIVVLDRRSMQVVGRLFAPTYMPLSGALGIWPGETRLVLDGAARTLYVIAATGADGDAIEPLPIARFDLPQP